jgi:hypothetical protein
MLPVGFVFVLLLYFLEVSSNWACIRIDELFAVVALFEMSESLHDLSFVSRKLQIGRINVLRSVFEMNDFFWSMIEFMKVIFLRKVSLLSSGVKGLIVWMVV